MKRFVRARRTSWRYAGAPIRLPVWFMPALLALIALGAWFTRGHTPASSPPADAAAASTPAIEGWATFYADAFQGLPMANGNIFDMRDPAITASNTWPLGTVLEVRRVEGGPWDETLTPAERAAYFGERLIVRVTDRGDFTHPLDLSAAAFARLGRPAEGVIRVAVRAITVPAE